MLEIGRFLSVWGPGGPPGGGPAPEAGDAAARAPALPPTPPQPPPPLEGRRRRLGPHVNSTLTAPCWMGQRSRTNWMRRSTWHRGPRMRTAPAAATRAETAPHAKAQEFRDLQLWGVDARGLGWSKALSWANKRRARGRREGGGQGHGRGWRHCQERVGYRDHVTRSQARRGLLASLNSVRHLLQ